MAESERLILTPAEAKAEEALSAALRKDAAANPLADFQPTNPYTLDLDLGPNRDLEKEAYLAKKTGLEKTFDVDLNELVPILTDILSGDKNALNTPAYSCLNLANVKTALDWLLSHNGMGDQLKALLTNEAWRLTFRAKPPTAEEFLGYKYIGPQSETLYKPVKKHFIESLNPMKPYRTLVLTPCIGFGKSLMTVLMNLYVSTCVSLMWHPYKFFGQSQPLDCDVWTPTGPKKMGDINVGDEVLTPDGVTDVVEIHPQGLIPTYEIELDDGRVTRCSAQHLWKVSYRKDVAGEKIWEIVNTQFMIDHQELEFEIPDFVDSR